MPRNRRLYLLLFPLVLAAVTQALPGRAQAPTSSRYAFADTLLMRDTLGLDFHLLYPVADSLQILPDSLRALMIRYRLPIHRVIHLADSLGVSADSIASKLEHEKFNPLATGGLTRGTNSFRYTSGYEVQRTSTRWTNGSEYRATRGAAYVNNTTNIEMDRFMSSGAISLRQQRDSQAEAGMRISPNFSFGGRGHFLRYDSRDPGSPVGQKETLNEFSFTTRARHPGTRGALSEITLLAGHLSDDKLGVEIKRGLSGRLDGHVRSLLGHWLTHDLSGAVSTNVARTRKPPALRDLRAFDLNTNMSGTMTMFAEQPIGLNLNYNLRNTRVDTPTDTFTINHILTTTNGAGATLRMRRDTDHSLNLNGTVGRVTNATGLRNDAGAHATLRWTLGGWDVDANYQDQRTRSEYPRQRNAYGYRENALTRSADGTIGRTFSPKLAGKLTGSINLGRSRYELTSSDATPPSPRDSYRQSYRAEGRYNQSERLSTRMALEVALTRAVNIDRRTTSSNNDTRSYRAEWSWNDRLLPGLTVSQTNQISADYQFYTFAPDRNNLSLNYNTITSISAVVTPRLSIELQHVVSRQPRGGYLKQGDGNEYLKLSDDSRNFSLRSNITYSPSPGFSLNITPDYHANGRSGTLNGEAVKQRDDKSLTLSGGANLNLKLGARGVLAGSISRNFTDQRTTSYQDGVGTLSPRSETDFWSGGLTLTWQL